MFVLEHIVFPWLKRQNIHYGLVHSVKVSDTHRPNQTASLRLISVSSTQKPSLYIENVWLPENKRKSLDIAFLLWLSTHQINVKEWLNCENNVLIIQQEQMSHIHCISHQLWIFELVLTHVFVAVRGQINDLFTLHEIWHHTTCDRDHVFQSLT